MRLLLEAAVRHKGLGPYHADRIRTWPPNVITKAFVFFKIETSAAYRVCAVGSAGLVITLYQSVLCSLSGLLKHFELQGARGTVMGGQQVCIQTFRPDDGGGCGGVIHRDIFVFRAKFHVGAKLILGPTPLASSFWSSHPYPITRTMP